MRRVVATVLGSNVIALGTFLATSALALPMAAAPPVAPPSSLTIPVEYYCSDGFAPTSGGRCVATASRDEIELFVNDPALVYGTEPRPLHRRRHHGIRERY